MRFFKKNITRKDGIVELEQLNTYLNNCTRDFDKCCENLNGCMFDFRMYWIDFRNGDMLAEWYLTEENPVVLRSKTPEAVTARWAELAHCRHERHLAYLIIAEEEIFSPLITVKGNCVVSLRLMAGLPQISEDGLRFVLSFVSEKGRWEIGSRTFVNDALPNIPMSLEFDVSNLGEKKGRFVITCHPGTANDPSMDWLAIVSFVVGPKDRIALLHAREKTTWRILNEISHFADVYSHDMYQSRQVTHALGEPLRPMISQRIQKPDPGEITKTKDARHAALLAKARHSISALNPKTEEDPYHFGIRLLRCLSSMPLHDFAARAASRPGKLRVLSICSGEAGVEANFFSQVLDRLHISLVDINKELLEKAASRFESAKCCDVFCYDVNDLPIFDDKFDIIVITSALHHVVELEELLDRVRLMLSDTGEFWVIGENIGATGSRLWPGAYRVANELFRNLPERFRLNRNTNAIDQDLPNFDCSSACFEGIRSNEIQELLRSYFVPLEEYTGNCFLWRFLNLAYVENFDMQREEHIDVIRELVAREWVYWSEGGCPTELYGIYLRKDLPHPAWSPPAGE